MTAEEASHHFESDGLRIEGRLHRGGDELAAVVLHPHPQYGGDMDNRVVTDICDVFTRSGATTLRFNFRGVGGSEGDYDEGRGEADDAKAAIASMRRVVPGAQVLLAGYSFGALVAARVAPDAGVNGLVLVSPPVTAANLPLLPEDVDTLIVSGSRDRVSAPEALANFSASRRCVVSILGADHTWWRGADELRHEIEQFVVRITQP